MAQATGPLFVIAGLGLGLLEQLFVERGQGPDLPIHNLFTLLFVPGTFFVVALCGAALGIALKDGRMALRLGLGGGLAGALSFLLVNLIFDAAGMRVGGPRAVERAVMVTTTLSGMLVATLVGGAVIGLLLDQRGAAADVAPASADI